MKLNEKGLSKFIDSRSYQLCIDYNIDCHMKDGNDNDGGLTTTFISLLVEAVAAVFRVCC